MVLSDSTGGDECPVAIGGIGGSGTRIVAQILLESGFFLGGDLNESNDNLWFTLLFKRTEILEEEGIRFEQLLETFLKGIIGYEAFSESEKKLVFDLASADRPQHTAAWLRKRAESLLATDNCVPKADRWGWKEPNTHIVISRLLKHLPALKYIHVIRNGLDMAYSTNQNQLKLWGPHFLEENVSYTPRNSLRFWCIANQRVIDLLDSTPARFLLLDFDRLCRTPESEIGKLLAFIGKKLEPGKIQQLSSLLHVPASVGRFKRHGLGGFDSEDVDYVRRLGFDTATL